MKKVLIISIACLSFLAFMKGDGMSAILDLIIAGHVPGTDYVVPYWLMMAVYCTVIALVIAHYIERALIHHNERRHELATHKPRMPKRRYSHI